MNYSVATDTSILNTLRFYYAKSGKESVTGQPFERWMYKAEEVFRKYDKGQVSNWHFETLEEYFGVPALSHLFSLQEYYMPNCPVQKSEADLKKYLRTPFINNKQIKMSIYDLRTMVAVMR